MAEFTPGKELAGFKYTNNAGRQELMRNMGVTKTKLYEGYVAFVKEAVASNGSFKMLDTSQAAVYYLTGDVVKKAKKGEFYV